VSRPDELERAALHRADQARIVSARKAARAALAAPAGPAAAVKAAWRPVLEERLERSSSA